MFTTTRALFQLTTVVVALAANACAVHDARPVQSAAKTIGCVGGVIQTAADASLYGACDSVKGDLRVSAPELTDLSALARLRSVSGTLEIAGNSGLDDLSGLERLERVGALSVHGNAELDDLSGLKNLQVVSSVVIRDNAELSSLRGLEGLRRLEKLIIEKNGLYQTAGLSSLIEVGALVIRDNAKLHSLQGFRSLTLAGSVQIQGNPRLCARGMLPALARVDRELDVSDNRGLSRPDVRALQGRVELGLTRPEMSDVANLEASLR